jgi:hypothetical protein
MAMLILNLGILNFETYHKYTPGINIFFCLCYERLDKIEILQMFKFIPYGTTQLQLWFKNTFYRIFPTVGVNPTYYLVYLIMLHDQFQWDYMGMAVSMHGSEV